MQTASFYNINDICLYMYLVEYTTLNVEVIEVDLAIF